MVNLMAVVAAAVTVTFAVTAAVMVFAVAVMVAADVGVVAEGAGNQCLDRFVSGTGNAAEETDAGCCKRILCAAADTAADQRIHLIVEQEAGQRTVTLTFGADNEFVGDDAVCDIVDLKLLCMSEMLENHAVFVGNCNSHTIFSLPECIVAVQKCARTVVSVWENYSTIFGICQLLC